MSDLRKAAEMALEFIVLSSSKDRAWFTEKEFEAVAALRQALAQDALKKLAEIDRELGLFDDQALAQPEQEPEWLDDGFGTMWQKCGKKDCGKFVVKIGKVDCWNGDCPETTAPPKREWVGLTDEDKDELLNLDNWTDIVEAVEAKLKEKNT